MSNRICALVWFAAAVAAAIAGFLILQSNLVFALCCVGVTVAFLAIAASCLLRDPPVAVEPDDDLDILDDPDAPARRKWHPR